MSGTRWVCFVWLAVLAAPASGAMTNATATIPAWSLVWADEFDQADGSAPDPKRWTYDVGGGGWGNQELESYTARTRNARIQSGALVIEVDREAFAGADGIARNYTSARLKTEGLAAWAYGRIEARVQLPRGQGVWPAFWTLGTNFTSAGWPDCGEIDIMENIGREPGTVHGTIHGPGFPAAGIGFPSTLLSGKHFADDYHVFALEWTPGEVRWLVDNQAYGTATAAGLPAGARWVFTQSQFILLNVAVGGSWPGSPDATTVFPQQMKVDYVRVYAATNAPPPALRAQWTASGPQARWAGEFPQARLEYSASLPGVWTLAPVTGTRFGAEFGEPIIPGYYRLR